MGKAAKGRQVLMLHVSSPARSTLFAKLFRELASQLAMLEMTHLLVAMVMKKGLFKSSSPIATQLPLSTFRMEVEILKAKHSTSEHSSGYVEQPSSVTHIAFGAA